MAKKNKLGTSFCGLGLEKHEELFIKKWLRDKDISAKQLLRSLIRGHMKSNGL